MGDFNAAMTMREVKERAEKSDRDEKFIPIAAAVIAVFAAIATLTSNHSSISGLEARTLAGIRQTRAADQYNYYESSRMKVEIDQGLVQAGLVTSGAARTALLRRTSAENAKSQKVLRQAQLEQQQSDAEMNRGERLMRAYEKYEVATTLFEVCIVLVSITALMKTRFLLYVAAPAIGIAFVFFFLGLTQH
jgi:hypothetical protein